VGAVAFRCRRRGPRLASVFICCGPIGSKLLPVASQHLFLRLPMCLPRFVHGVSCFVTNGSYTVGTSVIVGECQFIGVDGFSLIVQASRLSKRIKAMKRPSIKYINNRSLIKIPFYKFICTYLGDFLNLQPSSCLCVHESALLEDFPIPYDVQQF